MLTGKLGMKMFLADEMDYFVMPEDPRHIFPLVFFNRQKKRIVSEVNPLPADEQFPFFNHFSTPYDLTHLPIILRYFAEVPLKSPSFPFCITTKDAMFANKPKMQMLGYT